MWFVAMGSGDGLGHPHLHHHPEIQSGMDGQTVKDLDQLTLITQSIFSIFNLKSLLRWNLEHMFGHQI